jgi:hypothetical protein
MTNDSFHYAIAREATKAYFVGFVISLLLSISCWFVLIASPTASFPGAVDYVKANSVAAVFLFYVQNFLQGAYGFCLIALMIFLVGLLQTALLALPLAKFLSQGIVKDSSRSWLFYTCGGFLVGVGPWAVLAIVTHDPRIYRFENITLMFWPQAMTGVAAGLALKYRLVKLATATGIENSIK